MDHAQLPILIVGGGQAGARTLRALIDKGVTSPVILAGEEPHAPYDRPPLSKDLLKAFDPENADPLCPDEVLDAPNVALKLGDPVAAIDYDTRIATTVSGETIVFGALVLATGGRSRSLPIPGSDLCIGLRNMDDCARLSRAFDTAKQVTVIGGGVIGLEVAAAARERDIAVTVLEAGPRIMARILPPTASDWLARRHGANGTEIRTGISIQSVEPVGAGYLVHTDQGVLEADVVLAAVGMTPNTELAPQDAIGPTGGILTDASGRVPGHPDVYAAGDVAESFNAHFDAHVRLETWRNADRQPQSIAATIAGTPSEHTEVPWMWTDQLGHNVQVVGQWSEASEEVARGVPGEKGSSLFWTEGGVLTGGVLFDNGRDRRFLEALVQNKANVPHESLADPEVRLKKLA
ncbi:NAD(P)/FAD-dependent oxidoreductase [Roseovarius sp. SYSU LYC5161]|uniref:NAD(P)/FAD-dependent oxidoreductase n=1 Tax=Roseovarius halophilus (ex Wu et al. 2025) TaxID=3376060 RepID=UPI00399B417C